MSSSHVVVAFGASLIVLLAGSAVVSAAVMRESDLQIWQKQMSNASLLLADHVYQTTASAYMALDIIAERVRSGASGVRDRAGFERAMGARALFEMLRDKTEGFPQIDVATIVAADGRVINFTRSYPPPAIDLSDRDYFKAHLADPKLGDFISEPVRNKGNGKWVFYISRRVNGAAGDLVGLVLVGISVESYTGTYGRLGANLGKDASVSLFRDDCTLLVRWPANDELMGKRSTNGAVRRLLASGDREGVFRLDAPRFSDPGSRVTRLASARRVERYPLVVSVVATDDLYLANWRRSARFITVVTASAIAALALALGVLVRILRQRDRDVLALSESEQRCRSVIEACGEGIVKRRTDGSITAMNPAAERLLGVTTAQLERDAPDRSAIATVAEDGTPLAVGERPSRVALRTGRPDSRVVGVCKVDGAVTWLFVDAQPLRRSEGEPYYAVVTTFTDVTLQRQQAAEIERSRTQLALAMAGSRLGYWDWDLGSGRISYSSSWPELLGYGPEAIAPTFEAWAAVVHPDDSPRVRDAIVAHVKRRTPEIDAEYRMRSRDGAWRWIHSRARAVEWSSGGRARRIAGTHADVTRRREAEERLRDALATNERLVADLRISEERLRLALASGNHAEWDWDLRRDVFTHGERWWELLGGRPAGFSETLAGWKSILHPDDAERVSQRLWDCVEGRTPKYEASYRVRHASGAWRWVHSCGCVVEKDEAGRAVRVVGTRTDVTETHELHERLLAATRLASVGTLAAGVAHEINNPLAWVTSNLSYALEELSIDGAAPAGEFREALEEALQGAHRIASVVKSMRSLGRPERPEPLQPIDVRAEILNAVRMVRNQLEQRARVDVHVPDDLPFTRGATNELGRVFLNLLLNAAQAIPEGSAPANCIAVRAFARGREIVVEVTDSGVGIPREIRDRIFEPFFTTKPVGVGTGLGLSIAKSIVDAAAGQLEVVDGADRGTTFRVRLPLVREGESAPRAAPTAATGPARRRRVLVIDDEPLVGRSLERLLCRTSDVTVLTSAAEALLRLDRGERWDAIVCDLMMPELDGIAFYEALATRCPEALSRVAFVTGGVFGERIPRFLAEHHVTTLAKPVVAEELLEAIAALGRAPPGHPGRGARRSRTG